MGILPNTSAAGTANFGVSRVGGTGTESSGFRMIFSDPRASQLGVNQGAVNLGQTADIDGRNLLDTNGEALRGHFAPFRGSFGPQVGPEFLGSNSVSSNGRVSNPPLGAAQIFNLVGSRQFNFGSEGSGPLGNAMAPDAVPSHLVGDRAPIYRLYYIPRPETSNLGEREVNVSVLEMSGRYIFAFSGGNGLTAEPFVFDAQSFSFTVPAPGAGGLAMLALAAASRRRRTVNT